MFNCCGKEKNEICGEDMTTKHGLKIHKTTHATKSLMPNYYQLFSMKDKLIIISLLKYVIHLFYIFNKTKLQRYIYISSQK